MDFDLPAEAETYRDEVRAFIREHAPGGRFPSDWNVRLAEAGYVAPHWPQPWGLDAGPVEQLAIDEELRELHGPAPAQPDRHRLGRADAARRRHRGAAGALPARDPRRLRALVPAVQRARRRQRPRVAARPAPCATATSTSCNGQKVWTTLAHVAQFGILLARTDPDGRAAPRASRTSSSTCARPASRCGRSCR